jgi:hypothetical protein
MNHHPHPISPADRFGRRLSAHLDYSNQNLPYNINERLRAARMRAVAAKRGLQTQWETAQEIENQGGVLSLKFHSKFHSIFSSLLSIVPLICLAAGLVLLYDFHNDQSALELAEVDSALLVDDLPPQAYADPGFAHFLKNSANTKD